MKSELLLSIPTIQMPSIKKYEINKKDEKIISLKEKGIQVSSQYYQQQIEGSYKDCYARQTVAEMLLKVNKILEKQGLELLVYDGYRPICIQQNLWDKYRKELREKNPNISEKELDFKTSFFVSKPSLNVKLPSLHNTGGAIDVTLIDIKTKQPLNMGTQFDDFGDKAWTNYYEIHELNSEDQIIQKNRRILYNAMKEVGFTNLPSEWWHYDYGTKFWAYFNQTDALYEGILDIDFSDRLFTQNEIDQIERE